MMHIFDTDLFTLSELPDSPEYARLHARVAQLSGGDRIATTIITYEEQTRGWLGYAAKSHASHHQIKSYALLKQHLLNYLDWEVLDFDIAAAGQFEHLQRLKLHIGTSDLKIAAIALSQNAILLTRNLRHFAKIPDLQVEDWTSP